MTQLKVLGLAGGVTVLVLSFWSPGVAAQDDSQPVAPSSIVSGDASEIDLVETGEQLYSTSCVSCHGRNGTGTVDGPDISEVGELGADFMLRTGRMPLAQPGPQAPSKPPAYTDDEISALVKYVGAFGDGPAIPAVDTDNADLSNGGNLFRANCQACHNASGAGGALSYGRHAPELHHVEPTQVVEAMRFGPGEMPVFGADIFSAEQADDVAKYVEYLREPESPGGFGLGFLGPTTEGFVAWLVGIGLAIWAIRWITREVGKSRAPTPIEATAPDASKGAHDS
jgi:ubiquinol-cytochrome c reductase cytochrome c subunit